ncbi:MAG: RagB/SusD family nutrient uptake outer membrane protein [Sphingobacterium sp.]|jgi:hypothetical protein|nr:RagB/SusD family nutrient uptake outer membrane protein [Sphingobacterium sp.]
MKNRSTYVLLLLVALLVSCNKKLDLSPENNLVESELLEDRNTTERLIAGGFYTQYLIERDALPIADLSTGNLYLVTNTYYNGTVDPTSPVLARIWTEHYKVINIANVVINNLPKYAKFEETVQRQFIAEAKFLRAYSYFRLALLFADGWYGANGSSKLAVPLRLDAFSRSDESQYIPRSTNQQVFDRVIQDLEEAIPDLPLSYPTATQVDVKLRSRAVQSVAKALLTRIYLYQHRDVDVVKMADAVLSDASYNLANSPDLVFPNNSSVIAAPANIPFNKEIIYGFPVSWNTALSSNTANNFQYAVDPTFVKTYTEHDIRRSTMLQTLAPTQTIPEGEIRSNKYTSPNMYDNMVVIRLAEVVLNKAEALTNIEGVNQAAIDLLNSIHQRAFSAVNKPAPYTISSFASKQQFLEVLWRERNWELAFEGHDRFDRMRTGRAINPVIPANRYAFPIPQAEISISNGFLKQNPDY